MESKSTSDHSKESEAARKIAEIEQTIRQMERAAADLDRHIEAEEIKTKVHDSTDPGYSSFAGSAQQRRDKLCASIRRLKLELDVVRREKLRPSKPGSSVLSAPLDF